jgi:hypothetical protein
MYLYYLNTMGNVLLFHPISISVQVRVCVFTIHVLFKSPYESYTLILATEGDIMTPLYDSQCNRSTFRGGHLFTDASRKEVNCSRHI